MTRVSKFLRLERGERRLLVRCACVLAAMRVGLCVVSLRKLHALVTRAARRRRALPAARRHSVEDIEWAIRAAARHVPGATCLPQALAAELMLTRHGHPARLRIGMAMTGNRTLEGHAWVESDGAIVLGGHDLTRYTPLPALEAEPR